MSKSPSGIDQVNEYDRVGLGDQQLWTDAQQLEIGVQALKRHRDASADAVQIQMAHRKGDQAQTICPGRVKQESTQEIKEAFWRPAKEAEVPVIRLAHTASGAGEQISTKLWVGWCSRAIKQST
jgi:hypothetical protein